MAVNHTEKSLNVLIVGTGIAGAGLHLPAFQMCPEVTVRGICDSNLELAKKVAREHGIPTAYASLEEALQKENIQAVSICTPPQTHLALATTAMEHGCHVLLEKPMTTTLEEAEALREVQLRTKCKLSVVHQFKWNPGMVRVRQMIDQGTIGKVVQLNMIWLRDGAMDRMIADEKYWANSLNGGRWTECIPHLFYIAYTMVGEMELIDITAKSVTGRWPWLPGDEVQVTLGSSTGYVTIRFSANMEGRRAEINMLYGSKQTVSFDYAGNVKPVPTPLLSFPMISEFITRKSWRIKERIIRGLGLRRSTLGLGNHWYVIRRFVDHVLYDAPPPTSFEEAIHTMQLTLEFGKALEAKLQRQRGRAGLLKPDQNPLASTHVESLLRMNE